MKPNYIIFLILISGCYPNKYDKDQSEQPKPSPMTMSRGAVDPFDTIGKTDNTHNQWVNGIHFIGQVAAAPDPEGDTNYWTIAHQTTPGAYGITHRYGFLHVQDEELAKGKHLVTVKLYDKNDTTVFSTKEIPIFGLEDGGGWVGCDTVISIIDSTWIPGHWEFDTNWFRLVPACWDTIPIERL
jgi:hypothetical protein